MRCPKCGNEMIQEYLDGPLGTTYLLWICLVCGYEEDVADSGC